MCPTATGDSRRATARLPRARENSAKSETLLNGREQGSAGTIGRSDIESFPGGAPRIRVQISAPNELVGESLRRALGNVENIDVVSERSVGASFSHFAHQSGGKPADVLILFSGGQLYADIEAIRTSRAGNQASKILFLGKPVEDSDFLQYVRAGISGFLSHDASWKDLAQAIKNVHAGKAVCSGELCAALFRFFEDAEPRLAFGSPTQRLGLTRREQQIVPLIAKGFTNKEIANHFCLSEQTVKNHLYRMKHKIGAEDRLSIVQKFRTRGLML